jgi:predicted lipoprotein
MTPVDGSTSGTSRRRGLSPATKRAIPVVAVVVLLVAMALNIKVVSDSSALAKGPQAFAPAKWGAENFPKVQATLQKKAVPAATLATALKKNQQAATKKYGVQAGTGPEFAVSFTGTAGKAQSGIYPVTVPGVPKGLLIRVQTGPAINGTDLRDAPGDITFGQFTNQIDYQNAAAALNNELKKRVLGQVDAAHLQGKKVSVVGAFQLINPDAWLVTPATLKVAK